MPPSFKTSKNLDRNIANGTCLQGYIDADYSRLVELFGEPVDSDGYKVDAEWILETPFGIGTIYNYKDGKSYLGDEGLDIIDIIDWHIDGKNKETALIIKTAIEGFIAGYNLK